MYLRCAGGSASVHDDGCVVLVWWDILHSGAGTQGNHVLEGVDTNTILETLSKNNFDGFLIEKVSTKDVSNKQTNKNYLSLLLNHFQTRGWVFVLE